MKSMKLPQDKYNPSGRNLRNVWSIPGCDTDVWRINTKGFKEAHFATFTPDLVKPMIEIATPERGCCPTCGKAWVRVVKNDFEIDHYSPNKRATSSYAGEVGISKSQTLGWMPACAHKFYQLRKDLSNEEIEIIKKRMGLN